MVRIAFLQNFWYEFLGVMYLSSLLKKNGHSCEVFIESGERNIYESVEKYNPHIIGFYATTGTHNWALKIADELKKRTNAKIIMGGPHPTFFPEIISDPSLDIICRGEGEYAMLELAECLDKGKPYNNIQNLLGKKRQHHNRK